MSINSPEKNFQSSKIVESFSKYAITRLNTNVNGYHMQPSSIIKPPSSALVYVNMTKPPSVIVKPEIKQIKQHFFTAIDFVLLRGGSSNLLEPMTTSLR